MNCWKIKKLQTNNFRNLKNSLFEFSNTINCIFGDNGNGKTNLLEAIHYLTNKKSFRKNTSFPQILNIEGEKPEILIQSTFENEDKSFASVENIRTYSLRIQSQKEERYLNNKLVKKKTLNSSVFLNPFDSYQFHTSSSFRRTWVDSHISLLDENYRKNFYRFQKSLRFRNSLLNFDNPSHRKQLLAIDLQIAEYSSFLLKRRESFIQEINGYLTDVFKNIFSMENHLELCLESHFKDFSQDNIFNYYRNIEDQEFLQKKTTKGVHRDDFIFHFDGLNSFEFCSLGQQKMAFLSLIFAYIELFQYSSGSYPIVLIDDVSGELDSQRWKNLIQYLVKQKFQVLITTANENFGKELEKIPDSKNFYLEHGMLIKPE